MQIDRVIQSISPYTLPIKSINSEIDITAINFYGYWCLGVCTKEAYNKNDNNKPYRIICGYGHVIRDGDGHKIQSADTSYFPEANAYLTYSYFWTYMTSMKRFLTNIKYKPGKWYLGVSYIPPSFERIYYKT